MTMQLGSRFSPAKVLVSLVLAVYLSYSPLVFANSLLNDSILNNDAIGDSDFVLVFDNFTPQQVNQVMVYATRFKEYEQYEVLSQRSLDTQMHYISSIDAPLLSFNFSQTFEALNWDVITQQVENKYQFTFVREQPKPLPYGVW
jgi:hypothetical protein